MYFRREHLKTKRIIRLLYEVNYYETIFFLFNGILLTNVTKGASIAIFSPKTTAKNSI